MPKLQILALGLILFAVGCAPGPGPKSHAPRTLGKSRYPVAPEHPVIELALSGPVAASEAELSGLAWYGDKLVLLPQYPERLGNSLYILDRQEILATLGDTSLLPLKPRPVPIMGPPLASLVRGYEGLEALVFIRNRVFLTLEATFGRETRAYLLDGYIEPDLAAIHLDGSVLMEIPSQSSLKNFSDETVVAFGDTLLTFHEANGPGVNPGPVAHKFHISLTDEGVIPFPNLTYRVTDATELDSAGRFWVVNYLYPGEKDKFLTDSTDALLAAFGQGRTHRRNEAVERLIELHYDGTQVTMTSRPPVQLILQPDGNSRNWEGIAILPDKGFLLVTDKFPQTLLGFVPYKNLSPATDSTTVDSN